METATYTVDAIVPFVGVVDFGGVLIFRGEPVHEWVFVPWA